MFLLSSITFPQFCGHSFIKRRFKPYYITASVSLSSRLIRFSFKIRFIFLYSYSFHVVLYCAYLKTLLLEFKVMLQYMGKEFYLLYIYFCTVPMNINGYIPILINSLDTIVIDGNLLTGIRAGQLMLHGRLEAGPLLGGWAASPTPLSPLNSPGPCCLV